MLREVILGQEDVFTVGAIKPNICICKYQMWMCKFVEEIFCHSEDSKTVNNTTLLVSGTPLTAFALLQGSMDSIQIRAPCLHVPREYAYIYLFECSPTMCICCRRTEMCHEQTECAPSNNSSLFKLNHIDPTEWVQWENIFLENHSKSPLTAFQYLN